MHIKKPLLAVGAVAGIGLAGVTGLGVASAAAAPDGRDGLVDKIATKFNLNKSEVEAVFEETRTERQAGQQQRAEERLDELVAEGKLSEAQKSAILAKHDELKAGRESMHALKDTAHDERHAQMQQLREELQAWTEENDIPAEYLRFVFGFHGNAHDAMRHELRPGDSAE